MKPKILEVFQTENMKLVSCIVKKKWKLEFETN